MANTGTDAPTRRADAKDRGDAVASLLRGCRSEDEFVEASRGVLPEDEVRGRYAFAPNFGQFRMVIANRMRQEIARVRAAMIAERRSDRAARR